MAKFQTMPNGCELRDQLGKDWAVQVKPQGAAASEYMFLKGITSFNPSLNTNMTDSTTIDMDGWTGQTPISRDLRVNIEGKYVVISDIATMDKSQELLKVAAEEMVPVDVRYWRTDVDEGKEATFYVNWSESAGDLRTFTAELSNNCAPTHIHSVEEGQAQAESVPVADEERTRILTPGGAPAGGTTRIGDTGATA